MILGIDIGGTAIKYGVVTNAGNLVEKWSVPNDRSGFEAFYTILSSLIETVRSTYQIEGIALSIPSAVSPETGMIMLDGSLPFLKGVSLSNLLKEAYGMPVHSENDGNCAALAEVWKGVGKACNDVALVVIGTGVGGAVVKDRHIHSGANLISGEFGYGIFDFDPLTGAFNTWSDGGAVYALTERLKAAKGRTFTGHEVFELAEQGDADAVKEVDRFYAYNAIGIFNLQYSYDPEMIIVGGAISSRPDFLQSLEVKMDALLSKMPHAAVRPTIRCAEYGNDANILGAVFNYLQRENIL